MTVCLGPFSSNPASLEIKMTVRDFVQESLLKKQKNFEKVVLKDKSSGVFYLLLQLTSELCIQDDLCVFISAPSANKTPLIDFRFWLNVNYI